MSVMRVNTETLAALTDEIGLKTGLDEALTAKQAIIDIAASPTRPRSYPAYVAEEAARVAGRVKPYQTADSITIVTVSDMHVSHKQAETYTNSPLHACIAARIVADAVGADLVAVLGDYTNGSGSSDTLEDMLADFMVANRQMANLDPQGRLYGNHDLHPYVPAAWEELRLTARNYITRFAYGVTTPAEAWRGYVYKDVGNTRVIMINTSDLYDLTAEEIAAGYGGQVNGANIDGCFVSAAQLTWLVSLLSADKDESITNTVLLTHHPLDWGTVFRQNNMAQLLEIVRAYNAGNNGTVTAAKGETISYNFSGKNTAPLYLNIHGHLHNLRDREITVDGSGTGIYALCTPNACLGRNSEINDNGSTTVRNTFGDWVTPNLGKTAGAYNDTSFVVTVIDPVAQVANSICYGLGTGSGYGRDRVVSWGDIVYHSVTCYWDDAVVLTPKPGNIADGSALSITLNLADNYKVTDVTVTMSGEDITATAYKDGEIKISAVTGAVVVTVATAYVPPAAFVNLVETAVDTDGNIYNGIGYKLDAQLSDLESGGSYEISTVSGYVTTGFIPYGPGETVFYISGFSAPNNANFRAVVDNDYTQPGKEFWYNIGGSTFGARFGSEEMANGVYKVTITAHGATLGKYIRLSGPVTSGEIIVTTTDISGG